MATEQAANSDTVTISVTAASPNRSVNGRKAQASTAPISTPVMPSRRTRWLTGTPTDNPRTTTVTVCVPTASARYTTPGRKNASVTLAASRSSKEPSRTADTAAPARPSSSQGIRWRNRLPTGSSAAVLATAEPFR